MEIGDFVTIEKLRFLMQLGEMDMEIPETFELDNNVFPDPSQSFVVVSKNKTICLIANLKKQVFFYPAHALKQMECSTFQVGDEVKIVERRYIYPHYEQWVRFHSPKETITFGKVPETSFGTFVIKTIAPHGNKQGEWLALISNGEENFVCNLEGLKLWTKEERAKEAEELLAELCLLIDTSPLREGEKIAVRNAKRANELFARIEGFFVE